MEDVFSETDSQTKAWSSGKTPTVGMIDYQPMSGRTPVTSPMLGCITLTAAGWTVTQQGDEIMNVAIPPDLIGFVQAQVADVHLSSEQEMIAQGLRLLQLQSERFADLRREIGIGIGALAPGGDDERNKFPPKRKRPSTFSTRYPQFEQLPRPLPSPSPADVFRWNVEGRNLGKAAVLHMLDYRLEHRISKTQ